MYVRAYIIMAYCSFELVSTHSYIHTHLFAMRSSDVTLQCNDIGEGLDGHQIHTHYQTRHRHKLASHLQSKH